MTGSQKKSRAKPPSLHTQCCNYNILMFCQLIFRAYNNFCSGEHVGTHIDAPIHYKGETRWTKVALHEVPLENLMGPAVRIDIRHKVQGKQEYGITVQDLEVRVTQRLHSYQYTLYSLLCVTLQKNRVLE